MGGGGGEKEIKENDFVTFVKREKAEGNDWIL